MNGKFNSLRKKIDRQSIHNTFLYIMCISYYPITTSVAKTDCDQGETEVKQIDICLSNWVIHRLSPNLSHNNRHFFTRAMHLMHTTVHVNPCTHRHTNTYAQCMHEHTHVHSHTIHMYACIHTQHTHTHIVTCANIPISSKWR